MAQIWGASSSAISRMGRFSVYRGQEDTIMARHPLDHIETNDGSQRLERFLRLARRDHRNAAAEALLRRPRSRNRPGGLIAGWVKARTPEQV
jgi:hypothetical protein